MKMSFDHSVLALPSRPAAGARRAAALLLAMVTFLTVIAAGVAGATAGDAHAGVVGDIIQYIMCSWEDPNKKDGDDTPAPMKTFYEMSTTDDFWYWTMSKSAAGADVDAVDNNLMNLLSQKNYEKTNLDIINNGNQTSTVYTPYDRFGFAGLKWSTYLGEWNWIKVYYCTSDEKGTGEDKDPEDLQINLYYDGRQRPVDTWNARSNSDDPRVVQHYASTFGKFNSNFAMNAANGVFAVTKFLVSLSNSFVQLSLSDVSAKFGLDTASQTIATNLFNGMFKPLLAMMMGLTGAWFAWKGIAQRKTREAFIQVGKSLLIMVVGFVFIANPEVCINLPNNLGMLGEVLVLEGVNKTTTFSGDDICVTENQDAKLTAEDKDYSNGDGNLDKETLKQQLDTAADGVSRAVTCQYWKVFAFAPWAFGQYGTDYKNLWSQGHAENGGKELGNASKYPGFAALPVGGNKVLYNWALYQISAQTDAHIPSPTANAENGAVEKPEKPWDALYKFDATVKRVDSVNQDWYRVVDALSGYDRDGDANCKAAKDTSACGQKKTGQGYDISPYWHDWIGGNTSYRVGVAAISIVMAVVGLIGPLILGGSIIALAIMSMIVMAVCPVVLTLGMWAGRGEQILRGWFSLLASTVLKRVVLSVVYVVLLTLILTIMNRITGIGDYFKNILLIGLVSYAVVKNRDRIASTFGRINVGGMDMTATADRIGNKLNATGRFARQLAVGAATGAVSGAANNVGGKYGGSGNPFAGAAKGAGAAMKSVTMQAMQTTNFGQQTQRAEWKAEYDKTGGEGMQEQICVWCGRKFSDPEAYQYVSGQYGDEIVCNDCYNDWYESQGARY